MTEKKEAYDYEDEDDTVTNELAGATTLLVAFDDGRHDGKKEVEMKLTMNKNMVIIII